MSKLCFYPIATPIGDLLAGFTAQGLAILSFNSLEDVKIPKRLEELERAEEQTEAHVRLTEELSDYFKGERNEFDIPLDLHGTDFQISVWKALLNVPFGVTRSYKEQATVLGDVKAIRAVASANGANPVVILVPCHRIVGSNQSLIGYAGGLERKQFLLELESNQERLF